MYDRTWIAARIPHQGSMCLLDEVLHFDAQSVTCLARSHTAADNPLRAQEQLASAHGIEYAAQAMAVHGALLAGDEASAPRAGFLASVRDVQWHAPRLDTFTSPLTVRAQRIGGDGNNVLYAFSIHAEADEILSGRAAVVLDAATHLGNSI